MSSARRSAAALRQWAFENDPAARTANGRRAFLDRFEQEAAKGNPGLSDEELAKRAERLRRAYFKELAFKSAAVRKSRSLKSRIPPDPAADASGAS